MSDASLGLLSKHQSSNYILITVCRETVEDRWMLRSSKTQGKMLAMVKKGLM